MDDEIIEKLKQLEYILHLDSGWIITDIFRSLGAGVVFILMFLNSFLERIIDKIVTLNDFYSTGPIGELMDKLRPFIWGLFFIALVILGIQFMLNKIEKRNEVMLNVVLAITVIILIPDVMTNLNKLTNEGISYINPEKDTFASELVKSNVADVLYYARNDFNYEEGIGSEGMPPRPVSKENTSIGTTDFTHANQLSKDTLPYLPYTQKLDIHEKSDWLDSLSKETQEVLKNKIVPTGVGNELELQELAKNDVPMTKIGRETYYRYHVNWGVLIISLAITTLALAITTIKIGRAIFDLAFHQIFGLFVAATDLTGGQRTKKILMEIMSTFAVIFIMVLLLKLFILYSSWVNDLKGDIGSVGVVFLLIAGAWALIDAPDIVQRMLGIDAGLRSGYQALMGAYAGTKLAGTTTKSVGKGVGTIGTVGVTATAGTGNFARRMKQGVTGEKQQSSERQANDVSDNVIPNESVSEQVTGEKGMREAHYTNTIIRGSKTAHQIKRNVVRAGNSGYSLGRSIRNLRDKKPIAKKNIQKESDQHEIRDTKRD